MDWLNPTAPFTSVQFLFLYPALVVAAIFAVRAMIAGASGQAPPGFTIDTERDPYEIAYLRGGGNELLRFAIFDLVQQGFLTVLPPEGKKKQSDQISVSPLTPPADRLSPFLQSIVSFYVVPQTGRQVFMSALPKAAAEFGEARFAARLSAAGYFTPDRARTLARNLRVIVPIGLLLVTGLRLAHAAVMGHSNIGFLIVEGFLGPFFVLMATRVPRLGPAGRAYLQRLRLALQPQGTMVAAADGASELLVAATGLSALANTPYASMNQAFRKPTSADGSCSSCGTSTGGDSSSGGDGGGGCGGGGCGG